MRHAIKFKRKQFVLIQVLPYLWHFFSRFFFHFIFFLFLFFFLKSCRASCWLYYMARKRGMSIEWPNRRERETGQRHNTQTRGEQNTRNKNWWYFFNWFYVFFSRFRFIHQVRAKLKGWSYSIRARWGRGGRRVKMALYRNGGEKQSVLSCKTFHNRRNQEQIINHANWVIRFVHST